MSFFPGEWLKREDTRLRFVFVLILSVLLVGTVLLGSLSLENRKQVYRPLGVEPMEPAFSDMNYILASLDCRRAGILPSEVCPAVQYFFIYPKSYYVLLGTGLGGQNTFVLSCCAFVLFFGSMAAYLRPRNWQQLFYISFLFLTAPMLLALERCNVDLVVVSLLALAVLCLEARIVPMASTVFIFLAVMLKVYPVAAWAGTMGRIGNRWLIAGAASCLVGLGLQADHIVFLKNNIIKIEYRSWGYDVMFLRLRPELDAVGMAWLVPNGIEQVFRVLAIMTSLWIAMRLYRKPCAPILEMKHSAGLVFAAALYCFCWFSGPNFEYRYMLLLLATPFLFRGDFGALKLPCTVVYCCTPLLFLLSRGKSLLAVKLSQEMIGTAVFCCLLAILVVQFLQVLDKARAGLRA